MTNNENHDPLTIPLVTSETTAALPEPVAQSIEPIASATRYETLSYEEALLRPRPITFRDLTGCITTIGGGPNGSHEPQSGNEPA